MSAFNRAIQWHQRALMNWADSALGLKTPHDEPNDLKRRKNDAVPDAQGHFQVKSLQELLSLNQVKSVSELLRAPSNLPSQPQHSASLHCTDVSSSSNGMKPTSIFLEQQTTGRSDSTTPLRSKRKASGVIKRKVNRGKASGSEPPTKKRVGSGQISMPQPGVPYQVFCSKLRYIPAVVLFSGCSGGSFSVENTELLSVEKCCHYDKQTNTLSCRDTPEICYPVQYFDIEDPADREVGWIEAVKLRPLDRDVVSPIHYARVLRYMQKYGHSTIGTHVYTSFDHSALAERGQQDLSGADVYLQACLRETLCSQTVQCPTEEMG